MRVGAMRHELCLNKADFGISRRHCLLVQTQMRHKGRPMTVTGYARVSTADQDLSI
jgi:hypothetical protein